MDWNFYGLREDPFGLTPDCRYLFLDEPQQEVLATLRESIADNRGFIALVSAPGIGKSTLLFQLMEDLHDVAVTGFVFQTTFQPIDILRLLWKELGLESEQADIVRMHHQFADGLARIAAMGKQFVLIVDEAQNLSPEALETIRLLANFENQRRKMVQIVFAGHPELETLLARPGLEHIKQRVAEFCRLKPFTLEQTRAYVDHRLKVAGHSGKPIFSEDAMAELFDLSKGIPRTINIYAFQAMSKAAKAKTHTISGEILRHAVYQFEGWEEMHAVAAEIPDLSQLPPMPDFPERPFSRAQDSDDELKTLLANVRADLERVGLQPAAPASPLEPTPIRDRSAAATAAAAAAPTLAPSDGSSAHALHAEKREIATDKIAVMPGKPRVVATPAVIQAKPAKAAPQRRLVMLIALLVITIGIAGAWWALGMRVPVRPFPSTAKAAVTAAPAAAHPVTSDVTNAAASSKLPNESTTAVESVPTEPKPAAATPKKTVVTAREIAADAAPHSNQAATGAPTVNLSLGAASVPNLSSALNATAASAAVEHNATVQAPKPVDQPKAIYPLVARQRNIQGSVVLHVKVNANGEPTEVKIVSGNPLLATSAVSAVRATRFYPATSDGTPVAGETDLKINFHQ